MRVHHRNIFILIIALSNAISLPAQIAEGKCKFVGNIIAGYTPSNFSTYWNQVTPENAGKWGSVEATQDVMSWNNLDLAHVTATSNDFPFKQHTLVWGQQQPSWIDALAPEDQLAEVEEWISEFCNRYPDTDYIDVVNEPTHAPPSYATALGGGGSTGYDWIVWSFQKARQYCPNSKLILNDYNILNSESATTGYIQIINVLKNLGLIDIIGVQGHFLESTENEVLKSNLDKLWATGIPIHVTEYDINLADDTQQRNVLMNQFPVLYTHPGVRGITFWGFKQNEIWRTDAYLVRSDGSERPALTWLKGYVPTQNGGGFCYILSTEEFESAFDVYPNPSSDGHFTLNNEIGRVLIDIRDMHGRHISRIKEEQRGTAHFLIASPGIYLLEVTEGRRKIFKKIMVH